MAAPFHDARREGLRGREHAREHQLVPDERERGLQTRASPTGASSNGRSFASAGCGAWSVAITSIVPSARPALIAARSASVRSGGFTLNTGSKLAQHASVSVKWCGQASALTRRPWAFAARTISTAPAVDTCWKWTVRAGDPGEDEVPGDDDLLGRGRTPGDPETARPLALVHRAACPRASGPRRAG